MPKLDHLTCGVCAATAALDADLSEWRVAWITRDGSFHVCHPFGGDALLLEDVVSGLALVGGQRESAIVCGQLHALAIFERFLHRCTFVPTPNLPDALPASLSDHFADLT